MTKRWIITVLACLALVSAFAIYKYFEIRSAIESVAAQPEYFEVVEVFTAQEVDHTPTVKTLGVAIAPKQVTLRNELPGYISAVNFRSGAYVEQGQVIIQLDVSEQQANLESAKARAELAQLIYDRDADLRKSNAVSQESVDRSRSELNVVKAEIEAIRSIINRKTIRAPFNGVIGIHQFEPGQYLQVNTEITTLVGRSDQMWIDFAVPQFYGELRVGTMVRARVVRSQTADEDPFFEATVIAGNSSISTDARSRLYRATVRTENLQLLHNASVEVEVPVGTQRALIAVPSTAVQSNVEGQFVFALDPEADEQSYRARRLAVSIQGEQGDLVYVSGALQANTIVAASGAFKLREGVLVHAKTRPVLTSISGGE